MTIRHGALAGLIFLGTAGPTCAGDRPFLAVNSAAAEEDDDQVWSFSSWVTRQRGARSGQVSLEYAFSPTLSVQLEAGRTREKGNDTSLTQGEFEVKYLFNHIARDDFGIGISLGSAHAWARHAGMKERESSLALTVPFSWAVVPGSTLVHVNVGVEKPRHQASERFSAVGIEHELARRLSVYAEWAKEGEAKLVNLGARWWIKREKWAIDLSNYQVRVDGVRARGWVLGLSWYDL
jgi:hypothetical protein